MKSSTLAELRRQADRRYEAVKARLRERYRLARDLGFSPQEAGVLAGRSIDYIKDLAEKLPKP